MMPEKNQILTQQTTESIRVKSDDTIISVAELKLFIRDSVNEAMDHHCRIKAGDEVINEIPDLMNTIKNIGGGDISKGVSQIQENHQFVKSIRKTRDSISMKIANMITVAIFGGLLWAMWEGVKIYFKKG